MTVTAVAGNDQGLAPVIPTDPNEIVMARNLKAGPTVMSSDIKGTHYVEWAGNGDPSGGDIQEVPPEVRRTVQFKRAIRNHVIEIVSIDEAEGAFERQRDASEAREQAATLAVSTQIEHRANNDITVAKCIGPGPRPGTLCEIDVPVKEKTKDERPPLCGMHAGLALEFVPEQTHEGDKNVIRWVHATMAPRETQ